MFRLFLLLACLCLPALAEQYYALPLTRTDDGGRFFTPATIDERERYFLIDTASPELLQLSPAFARDLDKSPDEDGSLTLPSVIFSRLVDIEVIGVRVTDLEGIKQLKSQGRLYLADATMGAPLLAQMRAVLDCSGAKLLVPTAEIEPLHFRQQAAAAGFHLIPLEKAAGSQPLVDLSIKGKSFRFLLHSGTSLNFITPAALRALNQIPDEDSQKITLPRPVLGGKLRLPELSFQVQELQAQGLGTPERPFGGLISTRVLSRLRGKVDFGSYSIIIPNQDK